MSKQHSCLTCSVVVLWCSVGPKSFHCSQQRGSAGEVYFGVKILAGKEEGKKKAEGKRRVQKPQAEMCDLLQPMTGSAPLVTGSDHLNGFDLIKSCGKGHGCQIGPDDGIGEKDQAKQQSFGGKSQIPSTRGSISL